MYKEESKATEVRQFNERLDEPLINLLLAGKEKLEANIDGVIRCPLCSSDTIEIVETSEGDSERVYFQMKCSNCGIEFVLIEDLVQSCQRGIENAKNEIKYNEYKIDYFKEKLKGG